jgi:hypothetical protein
MEGRQPLVDARHRTCSTALGCSRSEKHAHARYECRGTPWPFAVVRVSCAPQAPFDKAVPARHAVQAVALVQLVQFPGHGVQPDWPANWPAEQAAASDGHMGQEGLQPESTWLMRRIGWHQWRWYNAACLA